MRKDEKRFKGTVTEKDQNRQCPKSRLLHYGNSVPSAGAGIPLQACRLFIGVCGLVCLLLGPRNYFTINFLMTERCWFSLSRILTKYVPAGNGLTSIRISPPDKGLA